MAHARRILCWISSVVLLVTVSISAAALSNEPETLLVLKNPRILGIHGEIRFTRADLEAMDQQEIQTSNDFVDGVATFRGPSAFALIDQIGRAGSDVVRMTAANDYFIDIDIMELADYGAILALEMNDKPLTIRDRGPIWLMYPIDQFEELQDSSINNRLIWQLETIELR